MNVVILHSLLMVLSFNADFTRCLTTDGRHRMHVSQRMLLDIKFLVSLFFSVTKIRAPTGKITRRLTIIEV
jgi:hypothetical protein